MTPAELITAQARNYLEAASDLNRDTIRAAMGWPAYGGALMAKYAAQVLCDHANIVQNSGLVWVCLDCDGRAT